MTVANPTWQGTRIFDADHTDRVDVITVPTFNLTFANPALVCRKPPSIELVPPPTDEEIVQAAIERNEEVMGPKLSRLIGKRVCVAGRHHLCGYRGVVIWCNEFLEQCGVRLEANNQLTVISPTFLRSAANVPV